MFHKVNIDLYKCSRYWCLIQLLYSSVCVCSYLWNLWKQKPSVFFWVLPIQTHCRLTAQSHPQYNSDRLSVVHTQTHEVTNQITITDNWHAGSSFGCFRPLYHIVKQDICLKQMPCHIHLPIKSQTSQMLCDLAAEGELQALWELSCTSAVQHTWSSSAFRLFSFPMRAVKKKGKEK